MKKIIPILLLLVLVIQAFSGCTGPTTQTPSSEPQSQSQAAPAPSENSPASESQSAEPANLTVFHHMGEQAKRDGLQAWADAVTAANPQYKYEINVVADANQYRQLIKTKIAAGDPADIMFGAARDYSDMIDAGNIADISNAPFISNYDASVLEGSTINGKIYGIPVDMGLLMVFYNKDIFAANGLSVPKTYAEFLNICQTLKDKDINPLAMGFKDAWTAGVDYMIEWYMMLDKDPNMFKDVMDGSKKFADYPMFKRGMERSRERFAMATGNPFGTGNDDSIQMFASGKAAMLPNGTWSISTVRDLNPDGKFGLFMMPADNEADTRARLFTDDCFMISANTKSVDGCYALFNFATSGEGANIWADYTGIIPATKGVSLSNPDEMTADAMAAKESGKTVFADTCIQPTGQRFDILFNFSADFLADQSKSIDQWLADFDTEFAAAG